MPRTRIRPVLKVLLWAIIGFFPGDDATAADTDKTPADESALMSPAEAKELEQLLNFRIPIWETILTIQSGAGFRDNVALSTVQSSSSALINNLLDISIFRLPTNGWQFFVLGSFEDTRFLDRNPVDKEQIGLLAAVLKKEIPNGWEWESAAQYFYQNQVIDLSTSVQLPGTLKVEGHTLVGRTALTRHFDKPYSLRAELELDRQNFAAPIDDYWEAIPRLRLTRHYGRRNEANLSYQASHRPYDHRAETGSTGMDVVGTRLEFLLHRTELGWRHYWDTRQRWRTDLRISRDWNQDNGGGFFNYRRWRLSEQLAWRRDRWETSAEFVWFNYDYPLQPSGRPDGSPRRRNDYVASLRVDRSLTEKLKLYVKWDFEISDSNQPGGDYSATGGHAGLVFEY